MSELSNEDKVRAKMIEAALVSSGLMQTIVTQVENGMKEGKVSIAEAAKHREILVVQAAQTMAKGIEGAFNALTEAGYIIVKEEGKEHGEDTSVAAQRGAESEGGPERERQSISESTGLEPESSSEGSTEWTRGDAA